MLVAYFLRIFFRPSALLYQAVEMPFHNRQFILS
jgi:hypothetical protein